MNTTITTNLHRSTRPLFWLAISLLIFTACLGGGGEDTPSPATGDAELLQPGTQGTLVCNAACSQWAQCGDRADNSGKVILAGRGGPAVMSHELIFNHETPVTVNGQETRTLQPAAAEPINMNFYFVTANDGSNKGGWVAGWCVQAAGN